MVEVVQTSEVRRRRETPLVEIEGLTFGYAARTLFYQVQASVRGGEMVGLLGPNGSGKTTLLRLLSGVLKPQAGRILLNGRELASWSRRGVARRVAVVPQGLQVSFAFTVGQMVALGRTPFVNLLGTYTSRDRAIVHEAMQATGVEELAARVFNELSEGERQRVLVAMALAQQPRLLLLDEPTSHLDIKYQIEILELVRQLNRARGVTVIAAMHDLNLAARYFPRLLLFQRGIVADGGPAEVLEPHLLRRVYGVNVQVGVMHGAEHLSVLPPGDPASAGEEQAEPLLVHVMVGGGTGALVMRALADARIPFSAGALNIGDSDHTLALRLAGEVITEQPFAPISAATRQHLRARLRTISLLILSPMPIGPGNLALLQEALNARQHGTVVILFSPSYSREISAGELPLEALAQLLNTPERDYARGEGIKLLCQLVESGATLTASVSEVVECARRATSAQSFPSAE